MERGKVRVHPKAESGEEDDERNEAGIEQILLRHDVTHFRVHDGEHNRAGQVAVRLEEGDNLGTGGGDDEDILRVAQDRVVEEDDEEHEAEGEELLALRRRRHRRLKFGHKALGLLDDLAAAVGGHAHSRRARRRDAHRGARRRMPRRAERGPGEGGGLAARDDGRRREGWDGHGESRSVGGAGVGGAPGGTAAAEREGAEGTADIQGLKKECPHNKNRPFFLLGARELLIERGIPDLSSMAPTQCGGRLGMTVWQRGKRSKKGGVLSYFRLPAQAQINTINTINTTHVASTLQYSTQG